MTKAQVALLARVREYNDKGQTSRHLPMGKSQGKVWQRLEELGAIVHVWGDEKLGGGWVIPDHSLVAHASIQEQLNKRIENREKKKERAIREVEEAEKELFDLRKLLRP